MRYTEKDIYKVICLPDIHVPHHDEIALRAVEKYMADEWFDEWLQLGDFMDFSYISKFTRDNLKLISESSFKEDYAIANHLLDRHQNILRRNNPDCRFTMLEGNHDYRVKLLTEKQPVLEGLVELEGNLRFEERGLKYVPYWSNKKPYKIGQALFIHGYVVSKNHAKTTVDDFGDSCVFYGHTHTIDSYSKRRFGKHNVVLAQSLGFLAKHDQDYVGGNPTAWQHAFGVFYFLPDGSFNHYVPIIVNGRFTAPNGKIYDGNIP